MLFLFLLLSLFQFEEVETSVRTLQTSEVFNLKNFVPAERPLFSFNLEEITAEAFLVKEIGGQTLLAKNIHLTKPIASLTKLMSAYVASSLYSPTTTFVFDKESVEEPGDVGYFQVGEEISFLDALKASLVASSNDAIFLLAKSYGLEKFVKLMNQKAQEFGMLRTRFSDPTGLSSQNLSTASDLFLLSEKILAKKPEIFVLTNLERISIKGKILWTTNFLLPKYKNFIVGSKTGLTEEAGECLLMVLKFNQSPFVTVILLNSKDRFKDAEKIIKALKNYYGN